MAEDRQHSSGFHDRGQRTQSALGFMAEDRQQSAQGFMAEDREHSTGFHNRGQRTQSAQGFMVDRQQSAQGLVA